MSINGRRVFSEIVEVCQNECVREAASNQRDKYKGFVNQCYLNDLPKVLPETYIQKEGFVTLAAEYTTGTVTIGTGTTGIQGASTSWTSAVNNFIAKVDGYDIIYRVTYSDNTLLTFQNSLAWIASSGSGLTYSLFQNRYTLPSDFSYMIMDDPEEPCVVSRYLNGVPIFLEQQDNEQFELNVPGIVGDPWAYTVKWVSETPYLFVQAAPEDVDIVRFFYIPQLTTLTEYTTGTVTFAATTAVIAAGAALWTTNVTTASNTYYIRNDADGTGSASKWFKISTVGNNTALTLTSTFGGTTGAAQTYTISEVSKWPARFDDAILYKAALLADPDNDQSKKWESLYQESIALDRSVEMRRRTTRPFKSFPGKR